MTFWDPIEQAYRMALRRVPLTNGPHQPLPPSVCPRRELPDTRDDFTRESESTGA